MGYLFNFDVNDGFFLIALFSWSVYYLGTGTKWAISRRGVKLIFRRGEKSGM